MLEPAAHPASPSALRELLVCLRGGLELRVRTRLSPGDWLRRTAVAGGFRDRLGDWRPASDVVSARVSLALPPAPGSAFRSPSSR